MQTQLRYFHAQLWLHGYWLHGDGRGFRDAEHRIHSSGDYKLRPPRGEHERLYQYNKSRLTDEPLPLVHDEQVAAMASIRHWFDHRGYDLIAAAVGQVHSHLLGHLPFGEPESAMGWLKKYASQRLGQAFAHRTGGLFAARGEPKPVLTFEHFAQAHSYILDHQNQGAIVWGVESSELLRWWNTLR